MPMTKQDRVYASIKAKIQSGELEYGDKMPSTKELLEEYKVGYGTLHVVMKLLKSEKVLVGFQGDGVYVGGKKEK